MKAAKLILIFGLLAILCGAAFAQLNIFGQSDEQKAQQVIQKTADTLGWPTDYGTVDGAPGKSVRVSPEGAVKEPKQFAAIYIQANDQESLNVMDTFEANGLLRSTFHGRDAIIMSKDDQTCPRPGTALASTRDILNMILIKPLASLLGNNDVPENWCFGSYGTILWRCGNYVFAVQDQSGTGGEYTIANALYTRAEEANLCSLEDTVVILAQSSDHKGAKSVNSFQNVAQNINSYFSRNSYNRVQFTYTFKDADGSTGSKDWYTLPNTETSYAWEQYPPAAIKAAFDGADLPEEVRLERVVVVYPGDGQQVVNTSHFYTACLWNQPTDFIEVQGPQHKTKIYVGNYIMVSENDEFGTWAHEFGHSLYSKDKTSYPGVDFQKITDRYNYAGNADRQYGTIGDWGLMGSGNWPGVPAATSPTHMSGYTKEAAGWLRYQYVNVNKSYTDTSLENKKAGDNVLRLDDPQSADARFYYIIEARDSTVSYGAPESGVEIYKVSYDTAASHSIVNIMWPQNGTKISSWPGGRQYVRPTLNSLSGNGSVFLHVPAKFKVTLSSQEINPYKGSFTVEEYDPTALVGAVIAPAGAPAVNPPAVPGMNANLYEGYAPDVDLHAYDAAGNHVGMNYATGDYENNIPGAIASGDLLGDEEWIFVPEGTAVRYEISGEKTREFLQAYPQLQQYYSPQDVAVSYITYDSTGTRYVADAGTVKVGKDATTAIKEPSDMALHYTTQDNPGFNKNSGGCCLGFIMLAFVGGFLLVRR